MKMLLVFLLLGILVVVVLRSLRNERSVVSRRFPGRGLPARHDSDTSYLGMSSFGTENSHHGQGHGHSHGADCAPSHDGGGSVDCGGGGDGGGGGGD
jgi:hypothetical protein